MNLETIYQTAFLTNYETVKYSIETLKLSLKESKYSDNVTRTMIEGLITLLEATNNNTANMISDDKIKDADERIQKRVVDFWTKFKV